MVNFFVEKLRVDDEKAREALDDAIAFIDKSIDELLSYERQYGHSMPRIEGEKIDVEVLKHLEAVNNLYDDGFQPPILPRLLSHGRALRDNEGRKRWLKRGAGGLKSVLYTIESDSELDDENSPANDSDQYGSKGAALQRPKVAKGNAPVFTVFHREEKLGETLARTLRLLAIRPIAYRAGSESNGPIIDQMREELAVGFAFVVLGTNDAKSLEREEGTNSSARNLMMEIGFLIGILGKDRVRVLRKGDIDLPPDIEKKMTIEIDAEGAWRLAVMKLLESRGYNVSVGLTSEDGVRSRMNVR